MCVKGKSITVILALTCAVFFTSTASAIDCDGGYIKEIGIGNASDAGTLPDYNDNAAGIYVIYTRLGSGETKKIAASGVHNLNDLQGMPFLSLLKTAMISGVPIRFLNNGGNNCNTFNTIKILT